MTARHPADPPFRPTAIEPRRRKLILYTKYRMPFAEHSWGGTSCPQRSSPTLSRIADAKGPHLPGSGKPTTTSSVDPGLRWSGCRGSPRWPSVFEFGFGAAGTPSAARLEPVARSGCCPCGRYSNPSVFPPDGCARRGSYRRGAAMLAGAKSEGVGFFSIAHSNLVIAHLGFAACGGIGGRPELAPTVSASSASGTRNGGNQDGFRVPADSPTAQRRSSSSSAMHFVPTPTCGCWTASASSCW